MKRENDTNNPYDVKAGEIWVEVDPRHEWIIEVISVDEEAGIARIKHPESGKITKARLNRFHGKRSGYARKVGK
jgi:hypothetical protein